MNNVQLIGRLTADPELRFAASGTAVGHFRLAVNRRGDDSGADFIDVVTFNRLAEVCAEHLAKGRQIAVAGRLSYSEWSAEDGSRRSKHEVIAEDVTFLGSPNRDQAQPDPASPTPVEAAAS
jgi:single-strand DNA-binding protein